MRYLNALIVISIILSLFVGCTNTEKEKQKQLEEQQRVERERKEAQVRPYPSETWFWTKYYAAAVDYMNNAQRQKFFSFDPNQIQKKNMYLKELGIDVLVDMKYLLSEAMDQNYVKPEDVKNIIFKKDTVWTDDYFYLGDMTVLWGSRFNGRGYTNMYFNFVDGKLIKWGVYSDIEAEEEGEIKAECGRINQLLGKIISKGESMESIRNKFTYFAEQNNELLNIYSKNELEAPEMKNSLTPATWKREDDKVLRQSVDAFMKPFYLLADKVPANDTPLGYQLKFKEPEVEHLREITYWYFYMPFGDKMIKYTITFRDRRVKSWNAVPVSKEY